MKKTKRVWFKAKPLSFPKKATGGDVFAASVVRALEHLQANEACAFARLHPEGVHQMRVALRCLRSAFTLFRSSLRDTGFPDRLKATIQTLGPARDWDVFLTETLAPVMKALPDEPALSVLHKRAESKRGEAYEAVRSLIESDDYAALKDDLRAWLESGIWRLGAQFDAPARQAASKILSRRHKRLKRAGKSKPNSASSTAHHGEEGTLRGGVLSLLVPKESGNAVF